MGCRHTKHAGWVTAQARTLGSHTKMLARRGMCKSSSTYFVFDHNELFPSHTSSITAAVV